MSITVWEFIKNQPETEKVIVDCDYNLYRCTIKDMKEYPEHKYYIIDSWKREKDPETWFFALDTSPDPMPEEITGEYLYMKIHDSRE